MSTSLNARIGKALAALDRLMKGFAVDRPVFAEQIADLLGADYTKEAAAMATKTREIADIYSILWSALMKLKRGVS